MKTITLGGAINEAIHEEMLLDERVFIQGLGVKGAAPGSHLGSLFETFGKNRARTVTMDEPVIAGSCVGAALAGMRPIADFSLADFAFCALDEILCKAGKWRYMHGANEDMCLPIVFIQMIGGYTSGAAEHSQSPMGLYMHSPGLKIVAPTNPHDAKGLMKTAIRDNNPVMFFIHKKLMGVSGEVPDEEFLVPFGKAQILRGGTDVTVVATSYMSNLAMSAATNLAEQGVAVEVIDPCTLEPLDIDSIVASVKKTGRLVVVDEDVERCGIGAEIGAQVMERAFESLKAPVQRIGNPNLPVPYSSVLEKAVLPSVERIESVVTAILK
jgi:pyruvate dehydrogenase E1 component beta subunit